MSFEPILYLGILIIAAKLLGELMHRIGQPSIIGNVLAGIIVGPALLALVDPIDAIDLFISIGVFFLFFLIGLEEIDLPGLFRVLRRRLFIGSAVGFLVRRRPGPGARLGQYRRLRHSSDQQSPHPALSGRRDGGDPRQPQSLDGTLDPHRVPGDGDNAGQ